MDEMLKIYKRFGNNKPLGLDDMQEKVIKLAIKLRPEIFEKLSSAYLANETFPTF